MGSFFIILLMLYLIITYTYSLWFLYDWVVRPHKLPCKSQLGRLATVIFMPVVLPSAIILHRHFNTEEVK
jgi:uncharacterized SAM-binding protein YcdF (DUF218 family)